MSEIYAIVDLDGYVREMRDAAAKSLAEDHEENLDEFISVNQMINLVKSECIGFDDNERPMLNEDANEMIYEKTVEWIHNAGLAKLAAQGLIECAWDNNLNEMIFWSKQDVGNSPTKKKRKSNGQSIKRRNKKKDP
jgi:hypothetical protein